MKRLKPITLWLATLSIVAFVLLFYEADQLWKVQQHNVFLNSSLFFKQQMVVPGGMLSWLGGYFTQHFFHPWIGVVLLCGWWLLLMWLVQRAFNIPERWKVLTLLPVAILLALNMNQGYWIYLIKLHGYFFVPTIGVTAATALLWAYRKLPDHLWNQKKCAALNNSLVIRVVYILLVTLVGYPLMGIYALAAVLLMGILAWRQHTCPRVSPVVICSIAILCVIFIPRFYYHFVYYETNLANIYRTALPVFSILEDYSEFYFPYYLLAACFLLMTITYRDSWEKVAPVVQKKDKSREKRLGKKQTKVQKPKKPILRWAIQGLLVAVVIGGVWHFWYKDANFHHELRMQRCIEQADWDGVIEEGTKQDGEPTRAIVMMHNLALSRKGRQCDEMYAFPKGSSKTNTPLPVYMHHIAGRMILYQYGLPNECHHICMEEGVEYGWNVELLQYMARCAIINKETQAARKFLDLLRQTCYYSDWADHMEQLLDNPGLLAKDPETGPITHMLHYLDHLDSVDGYVERFVNTSLAHQDADDNYFQEQAVLGAMWTRDPDLFWPRFQHYIDLNPNKEPPRIFQEAAWLFANLEGMEGLDQWSLRPGVKESFYTFMELMEQYRKSPSGSLKKTLFERFGNTYYFEFFFLKDITYF